MPSRKDKEIQARSPESSRMIRKSCGGHVLWSGLWWMMCIMEGTVGVAYVIETVGMMCDGRGCGDDMCCEAKDDWGRSKF
jgi:hypothetical protein